MNLGEYSPRLRLGEYSPRFTEPEANNCHVFDLSFKGKFYDRELGLLDRGARGGGGGTEVLGYVIDTQGVLIKETYVCETMGVSRLILISLVIFCRLYL